MSRNFPDYLRLHVESEDATRGVQVPRLEWEQVQFAIGQATGWVPQLNSNLGRIRSESLIPVDLRMEPAKLADGVSSEVGQELSARRLAGLVAEIWQQRDTALLRLRSSEAELATAIPVVSRANDRLADQLESILRGAAQLTQSVGAALYLLDDATTQLHLRACWGMDPTRLSEPPRSLRHAIADLEALTGHAVVLEDTRQLAHWNPPFDYASAACVPIRSVSMSLGTLWVFRDQQSDYSDHETHILEMVAEGMSAELERQVLLREVGKRATPRDTSKALWIPPDVDGWDVAGSAVDPVPRGFCFWHSRFDGDLVLSAGEALDQLELNDSLKLVLRAIADIHPTPEQILQHLNQSLWTEAGGSHFASAGVSFLRTSSGKISFANLGNAISLVVQDSEWELLGQTSTYVGELEGVVPIPATAQLERGDYWILVQPADRLPLDRECPAQIASTVLAHRNDRAQALADRLAKLELSGRRPAAVLVARRLPK